MADDRLTLAAHGTLTGPLVTDYEAGSFYLGPLDLGIKIAERERYVRITDRDELRPDPPLGHNARWLVELCDDTECTLVAEYGADDDLETAWRYALGAMFGPVDDGYDDGHVRLLLIAQTIPDLTDHKETERWLDSES